MSPGIANIYRVQYHIFIISTVRYIYGANETLSLYDIVLNIGYNKKHFAVICTEDIKKIVVNFYWTSTLRHQNSTCPNSVISYKYTKM